jgi:hypothetical protein
MLNRTNRTLSANLNRLNLGTRSLAPVSVNGKNSLRIRHAHALAMRAEMWGSSEPPIALGISITRFSGSTPPAPWSFADLVVRPVVVVGVVLDPSDSDAQAALAACPTDTLATQPQAWSSRPAQAEREALTAKRRFAGKAAKAYRAYAATATAITAATAAAAGG